MCETFAFSKASSCLFNQGTWEWSQKRAGVFWFCCLIFSWGIFHYGKLQFWQKENAFVKLPLET